MTLELTLSDLFTLVSSMATAVALGIAAGLGFKFARYRAPAQRAFSLTMGLSAYYVFCVGFSHGGWGRHFPALYASTQLLSGYIGPLLYFFCSSVANPLRKPSRWLLIGGVPGTVYSLYLLTHPDALAFLATYAIEREVLWHPVIVPLSLIHTLSLLGFVAWSCFLVLTQWWRVRPGRQRQALSWLVAALLSAVCTVVAVNVLPFFGLIELIPFSSLLLLPVAAMAYRALMIESTDASAIHQANDDHRLSRVESAGRVAKALVHDINNMLTAIVCHAELGLRKRTDTNAVHEHFSEIRSIGARAGVMHDRLISFTGRGRSSAKGTHPSEVISDTLSIIRPQVPEGVILESEIEDDIPVVAADPDEFHRAVTNLLMNAIEAINPQRGGRIHLAARTQEAAVIPREALGAELGGQPAVLLEVSDDGHGMDPQTADHVFEPFFSTKGSERGLGLMSVMAIARNSKAAMFFETAPAAGCVFRLWFPIRKEPAISTDVPSTLPLLQTALIVEDDDQVREGLRGLLTLCGVRVNCAVDGLDGLQAIEQATPPFDLALIDIRMPGIDGIELVQKIGSAHRPRQIILMSGDEPGARIETLPPGVTSFLRKPIGMDALTDALSLAIPEPEK